VFGGIYGIHGSFEITVLRARKQLYSPSGSRDLRVAADLPAVRNENCRSETFLIEARSNEMDLEEEKRGGMALKI